MSAIILYASASGVVPTDFGLGVLSDALKCTVTEERNGSYELELLYPSTGLHAEDIQVRRVIKAKPNFTDAPQLFRIYKVTKAIGGAFSVFAQHISYDLNGYLAAVGSANGAQAAAAYLSNGTPFNITTGKTSSKRFSVSAPASVRSYLAGREGSFLDVYGTAELHYDNYNLTINTSRGENRGVQIRYGKNLTQLTEDIGAENLYTAVRPYWLKNGEIVEGGTTPTGLTLDVPRVYALDCSNDFQDAPSVADLNAKASAYIGGHVLAAPDMNITLDFVQLSDVVERIDLCDVVGIYYEALGVSASAKCIKTTWDALQDRYTAIEFGTPKTNIAQTIVQIENTASTAVETAVSKSAAAINSATNLITGNSGGYVVLHKGADGKPYEALIMDTEDINTATKVWRWNNAGWGYSSTGYYGTYTLAATQDGAIVADFITTGTLNANIIKAGVISDLAGKNSINMETGDATFQGTITSTAGAIGGLTLSDNGLTVTATITHTADEYTQADLDRLLSIVQETIEPTEADYIKFDVNFDGVLNAKDLTQIYFMKDGTRPPTVSKTTTAYFGLGQKGVSAVTVDGTNIAGGYISTPSVIADSVTTKAAEVGELTANGTLVNNYQTITSGEDLNTLTAFGWYNCGSAATANTLSNCPITGARFTMLVMPASITQQVIFKGAQSGSIYTRSKTSTTWGPWYLHEGTPV